MTLSYFVEQSTPFTSLQEVEDAFDDAYDTSFTKDREYYVGSEHTQDAVKQYMQTHKDARKVYLSLHDSLEKDKCIALQHPVCLQIGLQIVAVLMHNQVSLHLQFHRSRHMWRRMEM